MHSAKGLWLVHNIHLELLLQTIPPSLGSGSDNAALAGYIISYDSGYTGTTRHAVMILIEHGVFCSYWFLMPLESRTKNDSTYNSAAAAYDMICSMP